MVYSQKKLFSTKGFCDVQNITDFTKEVIKKSKLQTGITSIHVSGSTASIATMEFEPNLVKDFSEMLEQIAPQNKKYHHGKTWGDDNGFSHLRSSLIGSSISIPFKKGDLLLGMWQQIVLCDFDNRAREREVVVMVYGE